MMRSRASELPELIRRLGSRKHSCFDAARARLAIIGPRAVEHLIEALEAADTRIRARIMPLLALIQDPRGRAPLIAMLLDRSVRLREIAARHLGRFPAPESVAALNRVLDKERSERVRVAAVQALVEQYDAGQDAALCKVLELINDATAPRAVRLAALALLPKLRPSARRGILERIQGEPDEAVRAAANRIIEAAGGGVPVEVSRVIADLASEDYATWNSAVGTLAECGAAAIEPLVAQMRSRAHDPEFAKRTGMALKAMGPRRARAVGNALEQNDDPLVLLVLVEVIGALGDRPQIYRLKDLLDRLARRPPHPADVNGLDPMARVRARAHLELARIGSRVAIDDLARLLADGEQRVEIELIAAVQLIGKRDELPALLRAYDREDAFTRARIADAVRTILRRERIRRNNRVFQALAPAERRTLAEILPPRPPRRARRPPASPPTASRNPSA